MTTYKFVGVPVYNPFSHQWAGVLKIRKYNPYVPLLDDGDEEVDQIAIFHAADQLGVVQAMERAIWERTPTDCQKCDLDGNLPCWKQVPPYEFWLNDEVCPRLSQRC